MVSRTLVTHAASFKRSFVTINTLTSHARMAYLERPKLPPLLSAERTLALPKMTSNCAFEGDFEVDYID